MEIMETYPNNPQENHKHLSRRNLLKWAGTTVGTLVLAGVAPYTSGSSGNGEEAPDQVSQEGPSAPDQPPPRTILQEPDPNAHFPSLGMIVQVLTAAEGSMCIHPVPPSYRYGEGTAAVSVPRGINDIFITSIYSGPQCRADQGAYAEKLAFQKQQGEVVIPVFVAGERGLDEGSASSTIQRYDVNEETEQEEMQRIATSQMGEHQGFRQLVGAWVCSSDPVPDDEIIVPSVFPAALRSPDQSIFGDQPVNVEVWRMMQRGAVLKEMIENNEDPDYQLWIHMFLHEDLYWAPREEPDTHKTVGELCLEASDLGGIDVRVIGMTPMSRQVGNVVEIEFWPWLQHHDANKMLCGEGVYAAYRWMRAKKLWLKLPSEMRVAVDAKVERMTREWDTDKIVAVKEPWRFPYPQPEPGYVMTGVVATLTLGGGLWVATRMGDMFVIYCFE